MKSAGLHAWLAAAGIIAATVVAVGQPGAPGRTAERALTPYIETHTHFDPRDPEGSVRAALDALPRQNATRVFLEAPPDTLDSPARYDVEVIRAAARRHPGQLALVGGGGTLNGMIQRAAASHDAGPEVQRRFSARAEELLTEGIAGFGEMTAEHFAGATPYQSVPPDHPLFLLLADIAARHGIPVVIHMEAVPQTMPLPDGLLSPPNAATLPANIRPFERLLAHDRRAPIVWAHAGSDGTGARTPALMRSLLGAHSNLYMEIKADPKNPGRNYPMTADGHVKPEWLTLLRDFPDRFVIGTDQHYPAEHPEEPQRWQAAVRILNELPPSLRQKIGMENAMRIYARGNSVGRDGQSREKPR